MVVRRERERWFALLYRYPELSGSSLSPSAGKRRCSCEPSGSLARGTTREPDGCHMNGIKTEDPQLVIANIMAFRLARVPNPTTEQMAAEAAIAGAMLHHAEHEGIQRWSELRQQIRKVEKAAQQPPSPEKPLSSSSAASFSPGDTP